MANLIPLSVPNLKGNELKYVEKAIKDEWVSTGGSYINDFEEKTAQYVKSKGAVACQSGTAGLHLALIASGVAQGDGVIVPALTFIAAVNPVKYLSAVPFFMDCDDSLCMDMEKAALFCEEECEFKEHRLVHKSGITIKAMIVVHIFGNMADMEKALELSRKYNVTLIEDATEALGSYINDGKLKGKFAGTIGDIGVYSYNGNKIITTGGGGMIVSDNIKMLEKVKYLSTQAKDDPLYYIHNDIGYNYRMTNIQAAIGLAQLEQLEHFIAIKEANYNRYEDNGIPLLKFRNSIRPNYWFYSYMTDRRDEMIRYMNKSGIQCRPIWNLICSLKPYERDCSYKVDKAKYYWNRVVNIPCSTNLTEKEIDRVSAVIKEFGNKWE